jgi:hypothetical protein
MFVGWPSNDKVGPWSGNLVLMIAAWITDFHLHGERWSFATFRTRMERAIKERAAVAPLMAVRR